MSEEQKETSPRQLVIRLSAWERKRLLPRCSRAQDSNHDVISGYTQIFSDHTLSKGLVLVTHYNNAYHSLFTYTIHKKLIHSNNNIN